MAVQRREHHIVPQFYLRRFADDQQRTWAIDIATNTGSLIPVKRATTTSGFYLFDTKTGDEHEGWEALLGVIESGAARSIRRIVEQQQWPLPRQSRVNWATWVAAQYLRTPKMRSYLDSSLDAWRESVDEGGPEAIRKSASRPDLTDDEAAALWKRADETILRHQIQPNGAYMRAFGNLLRGAAQNLFERRWRLVRFAQPSLMTADEVVVPIGQEGEAFPLITAADLVLVPLSRDVAVMACEHDPKGQRPDDAVMQDEHQAGMLNRMVIDNAHATVFRHPADHPLVAVTN